MGKRSIDMAIQLVFVILVMIIVAIIVIKMFTGASGEIKKISSNQQSQIQNYCQQEYSSSSVLEYCSSSYNSGSPILYSALNGITFCGNAISCPAFMSAIGSNEVTYDGYPVTPLLCLYLACEKYFSLGVPDPNATLDAFGIWIPTSNGGEFSIPSSFSSHGTSGSISFNIQSNGILNYGLSCNGQIPSWIQYEVINGLVNLMTYAANEYQCVIAVSKAPNGLIIIANNCNNNQLSNLPTNGPNLCSFITSFPIQTVAEATSLNSNQ